MNFWQKIANIGIDCNNYSELDKRNFRLMNSMTFILACAMIFFTLMSIAFKIYESLPQLAVAFIVTLLFYAVSKFTTPLTAKIYFCIIPVFIIAMFAISIVGEVGNDKYYLIASGLIPIIIFRDKKFYFPLFVFNIIAFYLVSWAQTIIAPVAILPQFELQLYIHINALIIFTFIIFLLNLFKKEIFGYQLEIEHQKEQIEEHSIEVRQSIEYAKKIQDAILPSELTRNTLIPNSFILYAPKDIVAGDFYWIDEQNDLIFFAAADCTGHGVPGAMVSVICCNALQSSVNEFGLTDPGQILDKTRELVINTFQKSDIKVKDGMDIGLCSYNKKTAELLFSGANNGLYLLKNNELIEFKPDKQPVGNFDQAKPFTTQKISIETGDLIYLFTDGFADQFGGEKGKKFKYKPFKELLLNISNTPITEQGTIILKEFNNWRGELEQIDDVCILGVKF